MCGIWALIGERLSIPDVRRWVSMLDKRGPESSRMYYGYKYQLGFTRLALNGLNDDGMQPMYYRDTTWLCNGEIYNAHTIAKEIGYVNKSGSDCEVIGPALSASNTLSEFFNRLHGVFAIVIVEDKRVIVGRDPYGVRPLFISTSDSRIVIASEMKAILPSQHVKPFPPGTYAIIDMETRSITYTQYHVQHIAPIVFDNVFSSIRESLLNSVKLRMLTERPIAALLSGGLDSSLIAALVQRELVSANRPPLETFSIGFQGSEDLRHARIVAEHIGSNHTEIIMTPDEFFDAIPEVIQDIESYDITTVRASVGNWLVAREISKCSQCKVVFNGDGSDELFGGYLYFFKAPSEKAFEEESDRLLKDIHLFDVLRSDRCISSHGLEARTPFLDKQFVDTVKSIPVNMRRPSAERMEKWVLREAFANSNLLPLDVLYRKKEAFSDGVSTHGGVSWYRECQSRALNRVPDWKDNVEYTHLPSHTAESFYYRMLFEKSYPNMSHVIPYFWMPKWSPETTDPSALTLHPTAVNTC